MQIVPLGPRDAAPAFTLLSRVFLQESTLHRALALSLPAYRAYLRPAFAAMCAETLSVVARGPDGEILGVLMATDYAAVLSAGPSPGPVAPVSAITRALRRKAALPPLAPGRAVLIDMAAVAPCARGRGLYPALRAAATHRAAARGYGHVFGELSSPATQLHVLHRLHHIRLAQIPLRPFRFAGRHPFSAIAAPPALILSRGAI